MAELLVSFCGPAAARAIWARVDFETGNLAWLPADALPEDVAGMGLCEDRSGYRALYMCQPAHAARSGIVEIDDQLHIRRAEPLALVQQAHSIVRYGDGFLVNSTGTDSIVRVAWNGEARPQEAMFWQASDGSHEMHVNSLLVFNGDVFVTMFGPRQQGGWFDTRAGSVWNITSGEKVCECLSHPHSLFVLGERLCLLESFSGRVLDIADGRPRELFRLAGYTRGVAQAGDYLYVATSMVRLRSKHTGQSYRQSKIRSKCGIYRIHMRSGCIERCELYEHAREIYDLAIVAA